MNSTSTEPREIRRFGLIALTIFGTLCALGFWREKAVPTCLFGVLSLLGLGLVLLPSTLKPIYTGWLKSTYFISRVITTLLLTLAYYLVITPSALIKRLFGGKPIPIRPDRSSLSYWVDRKEPVQPKERFLKRF